MHPALRFGDSVKCLCRLYDRCKSVCTDADRAFVKRGKSRLRISGWRGGVADERGGTLNTGERTDESNAYHETVDVSSHHIALLLGDDLNDISQIFSDCDNAIERVSLAIENIGNRGSEWIVFPNAVYGISANYAAQYGYPELFWEFDYKNGDSDAFEIYD